MFSGFMFLDKMAIIVRIEELPDGRFSDSFTGYIEKTETIFHEYEDYRGRHGSHDYDSTAQKQYNDACDNISTAMSMWINRPTYILKVLSIADMDVSVRRRPVTIKSRVFENLDYYKEESCNVDLEKEVYNSVESSWSNVQPFFNGEKIDYKIETLDSSSFYYSQRWGESTERSKSMVLKSPSASYPIVFIKPRKSINVELNATKTTVTVKIVYRCEYDEVTSYSYETIKAKFYTDPKIDF